MSITLVNPSNERKLIGVPAPRLQTLAGKTIALLDISKPGGSIFLDRLQELLMKRHGVAHVIRYMKPTYTKPAPEEVVQKLKGVDAVVEALAD
jgi:hypothetical protein